jgi:O-antigen/teichoic acid export membrane protein
LRGTLTRVAEGEFSESTPIAVGTVVWAVLFVVGLVIRPDLNDDGHGWWIWTAVAGVVLGLFGYTYMRRRQRRLRAFTAERAAAAAARTQAVTE